MDCRDAVTMLKAMFPSPDEGGPFIDKHPNGTGIIVRGKPEQVATSRSGSARVIGIAAARSEASGRLATTSASST